MREIKFRWVFKRKSDGHIYMIESKIEALEEKSSNGLKTMLGNELWKLVARDQSTGLKDKNGTEIFENDIEKTGGQVVFTSLSFDGDGATHPGFYCVKWFEYNEKGALSFHDRFDEETDEIIGNIHENPEAQP